MFGNYIITHIFWQFDLNSLISVPISIAGISAGALSGSVASPFYMLKTQQQSLSSIQVGNQHSESNTGMFRFFKSQVEKGGITGKKFDISFLYNFSDIYK